MAAYTKGSDALVPEVDFKAILDLDILEGEASEGSLQEQSPMEVEEEVLTTVETKSVPLQSQRLFRLHKR